MKKLLTSFGVAVLFIAYIFYQRNQTAGSTNSAALSAINSADQIQQVSDTPAINNNSNTNSTGSTNSSALPRGTTSSTTQTNTPPTPQPTGKFKDGVYTGVVADAYYGNIQVQATISGGKLTKIDFLQFPNDRSHSIEINYYALPILRTEAISNQSAQVDIVSGATDSSRAFIQSLQSALAKAS